MERVNLQPNIPQTLAFKFSEGREMNGQYGPSFMFTTTDDQVLFVPPVAAKQIHALGLNPGEPVRIVKAQTAKSKTPQWKVEKLVGEQPDGTFAIPQEEPARSITDAPAPAPVNQSNPAPANGHGTRFYGSQGRYVSALPEPADVAMRLRSTVNMLVDVQGDCLEYAKKYNGGVRAEDVRAILLTAYIGMSKGK